MKFNDITVGTRFLFEGMEYTKTDALLATSSDGKPRLIRRSASLAPLDSPMSKSDHALENPATLDKQKTLLAFDAFYNRCIEITGDNPDLASARLKFLNALK
jgi:hypothetical protein